MLIAQSLSFPLAVDCMWGVWSACSGTCGVGAQSRRKAVGEQNGGKVCAGSSVQACDTEQRPCKAVIQTPDCNI